MEVPAGFSATAERSPPKELKAAFDAAQALLAGVPTAVQSVTRALPSNGAPQKGGADSPFLRPAASLR